MTATQHPTFDELKDPSKGELWVDATLKMAESVSVYDAEWVPNGNKARQAGFLSDANGDTLPFINWENSNQQTLDQGTTYSFTDLFLVYGQTNDGFTLIFRSDTTIEEVDSQTGGLTSQCPHCSEELTTAHYGQGPEHPEIGWEYYECPACEEVVRPEQV